MITLYPTVASGGFSTGSNLSRVSAPNIMSPRRWMHEQSPVRVRAPSVSPNQMTSLSAMISYIAHRSGQSEFRIERSLADRFNVPNAKFLSAQDFDNAIRYLADILPA